MNTTQMTLLALAALLVGAPSVAAGTADALTSRDVAAVNTNSAVDDDATVNCEFAMVKKAGPSVVFASRDSAVLASDIAVTKSDPCGIIYVIVYCTLQYAGHVLGYTFDLVDYVGNTPLGNITAFDAAGEVLTFSLGVTFATVNYIFCLL